MKKSNYNIFLDKDDVVVAFNTRTSALAEMSKEDYQLYENDFENVSDQLRKELLFGGFILNEKLDELEMIRMNMLRDRYRTDELTLTIAPTSDCNFRCPYCYEKDVLKPGRMDDQTEEAIVNFVKGQANHLHHLSITWYGGEPLLELNRIESLTKQFLKICSEYHMDYSASIISNTYLLTKDYMK